MRSYVRILGYAGMVCIFAAFLTSCASHQKLGCPMRGMAKAPAIKHIKTC